MLGFDKKGNLRIIIHGRFTFRSYLCTMMKENPIIKEPP
jgi:hypothetical protein